MGSKEARPGRPLLSGCFPLGLKTSPSFWTCSAAQSEQVEGGRGRRWQGGRRGEESRVQCRAPAGPAQRQLWGGFYAGTGWKWQQRSWGS